jgi:hypothetical protein
VTNPSDIRASASRTAAQEEQRIAAIVDRRIRDYFKTGVPSGTYSQFQWDGSRIVGGSAVRNLVGLALRGASSAVNISQGSSVRLPFGTASFGAVTTGATAYITVPANGVYRVDCGIFMNGANGAYALNDFFDVYVHRQDTNASLGVVAYEVIDAGTYTPTVYLLGTKYVTLTAGLGVYLKAENQSSVAGNATAPTSSADFFAVSYA